MPHQRDPESFGVFHTDSLVMHAFLPVGVFTEAIPFLLTQFPIHQEGILPQLPNTLLQVKCSLAHLV